MPDYYNIRQFAGKKGPATYKAARGHSGRGTFSNLGQKPKTSKRIAEVDRKVKKVSNKLLKFKSKNPGKASYDRY